MTEVIFIRPDDAAKYIRSRAKYGELFIAHPLTDEFYVVVLGSLTENYSIVTASLMPAETVEQLRQEGAAILISEYVAGIDDDTPVARAVRKAADLLAAKLQMSLLTTALQKAAKDKENEDKEKSEG